jgi:hypothetical protein
MRIAWQTPVVFAVVIGIFLWFVVDPNTVLDVVALVVGSLLGGLAITAVGSWPDTGGDGGLGGN